MDYRRFGPRPGDALPSDKPCPACGNPFKKDEFTTLVPIGPGDSEESRRKCREGKAYNAVAVEAHYACVTGEE